MSDEALPISDDERADRELRIAAAKGVARHVSVGLWPAAVGVVMALASGTLTVIGCVRLGWWALIPAGYFLAAFVVSTVSFGKIRRRAAERQAGPLGEQVDELRERWERTRNQSWRAQFNKGFWRNLLAYTLPKVPFTAYGLALWWPLPAAAAVAAVPVVWAVVSRLIPNRRLDAALSLMLPPRGPDGLPTPEV
ncbi:hypothetical protein ABZ671_01350 [Micromonospora sp. NPDC006766]|uniref:hypothetical protein n=1 Tax=Micromonospora sp. NPDC006766 TaxID=3154778 RepID=UPI0033EF7344